jgi:hypothetical protein
MKCISLWQPWSLLVATGAKTCETRGWPTSYRGRLLIHAAKKWTPELALLAAEEPFNTALRGYNGFAFGAILGSVEVVGCYPTKDVRFVDGGDRAVIPWGGGVQLPESERPFGDYSPGRFVWLLADPVRFATPVPWRGFQGLFDVDLSGAAVPAEEGRPGQPSLFT